jgi:hypothetical protein
MFALKHKRLLRVVLKRQYCQGKEGKEGKDSTQWSRTFEAISNKTKDTVSSLKENGSKKISVYIVEDGINKCKQLGTSALEMINKNATGETNFEKIVGRIFGHNYLSVKVMIVKAFLCVLLLAFSFKFCNKGLDVFVEWIFK